MKLKILLFLLTFINEHMVSEGEQSLYNSQCDQFNNCNNHGYCANGGMWCMCNPQYNGVNCSECAPGYFNYPVCYSCKTYCQNGGICTNSTCVCPQNATDILCSNCAPNFNGQYCNQDPIGFSVITNETVYDIGGSSITIVGAHFNKNSSIGAGVLCSFASYAFWYSGYYSTGNVYYSSSGRMINESTLACVTPTMYPGSYNISFSLDNGTSWFNDGYNNELSRLTLEVLAYCPAGLNKCSTNGACQYGNCSCSLGFAGEKCDQCDEGYFDYPFCISCSQFCKNSAACVNGTCICNAPYSGSRCTDCSQESNGQGCLRIPVILSVTPQLVIDIGGNNLTVTVSNFDENITNVLCRFEAEAYPTNLSDLSCGYMINRTTINCLVPRMNASWRRLSISVSDGLMWIDSSLYIQVNGTCPRKCYQGECRFGECICYTNITGNSCLSCALGYYQYPNCYSCSICQANNGTCNQTSDNCICGDPLRFTGVLCNECQPNYYGPNCTNNTQLLSVVPRTVTDLSIINGTNISLVGNNLYFTSLSNVICKFEVSDATWIVPAISANSSAATCILLNGTQLDYISASLSLDNGTTWVDKLNVWWIYSIFIDGACPGNSACSYGSCSYGQCICAPNYAGFLCDQCANGYFAYPDCYNCSSYCANNGTCVNGTCLCTERFTGKLCTDCQPHYYGSQCLQIPSLLTVIPNQVPDVGGVNLTVIGEYFDENLTVVLCQFRLSTFPFTAQITSGNIINRTALTCFSPPMKTSIYELYVSMDNGTNWTSSYVYLSVNTSCPNGSNSCNLGQCSFGGCICNNYSTGPTCSSCAVGYYNFPNCYPCYYCEQNNGTCDRVSDKCICGDPARFTGTFCNLCQQSPSYPICNNNSQLVNISSICGYPMSSPSMLNSTSLTTPIEITSSVSILNSTSITTPIEVTSSLSMLSSTFMTTLKETTSSPSMLSSTFMTTLKEVTSSPSMLSSAVMTTVKEVTSSPSMLSSTFMTTLKETTSSPSMLNSTFMTTLKESTSVYLSTLMNSQTSTILLTTTTPTVTTNFYIQFLLSLSVNTTNTSGYQISIELIAIFTSALNISSNQINISVIIPSPFIRILTNVQAQVRLFNSVLKSAESALAQTRQQLADPTSSLRNHPLTSQLTDQSISDVRRIYVCDDKREQDTPCQASSTIQSSSSDSRATILLATIIPSVVGGILIVIIVILLIKYCRQHHEKSSKYKQSDFNIRSTNF